MSELPTDLDQAEMAYIAEQLLLRADDSKAQKEWVAENLSAPGDRDTQDTLDTWCTRTQNLKKDHPLFGFRDANTLLRYSEFYNPSREDSTPRLLLNDINFPDKEDLIIRHEMVLDVIIRRYYGVVPAEMGKTVTREIESIIDDTYGWRDFNIPPSYFHKEHAFRPLEGMVGYTEEMAGLRGAAAVQEMVTRRQRQLYGIPEDAIRIEFGQGVSPNLHYHGFNPDIPDSHLKSLIDVQAEKDDDMLAKIEELVLSLMDASIGGHLIIASVAMRFGVLIKQSDIDNRYTRRWKEMRGVTHRINSDYVQRNREECNKLRELATTGKAHPRARNDSRLRWIEDHSPGQVEDELLEEFRRGRQLGAEEYKKYIAEYGHYLGCSRKGCVYELENVIKTNITSSWSESLVAKKIAGDSAYFAKPPVVLCLCCAKIEKYLIHDRYGANSAHFAKHLLSGTGTRKDPSGRWERVCGICFSYIKSTMPVWKGLAERTRARGELTLSTLGETAVPCSSADCGNFTTSQTVETYRFQDYLFGDKWGWVDNSVPPKPICETCFTDKFGGVGPAYLRERFGQLRITNGSNREVVRRLAKEFILAIGEREYTRVENIQILVDIAARGAHTVFDRPISVARSKYLIEEAPRLIDNKQAALIYMLAAIDEVEASS